MSTVGAPYGWRSCVFYQTMAGAGVSLTARAFAKKFYKSTKWLKCRASYIAERRAIDGGLCERCRQVMGYIVHHVIWLTPENVNDPEITLNHDNLEYVCLDCHNRIEEGERYCLFDERGQVMAFDDRQAGER